MANIDAPVGFLHIDSLGGIAELQTYRVDVANATAIFKGDPITAEADGAVKASAAGDGNTVVAIATGFQDGDGQSALFQPALTAGTITGIPVINQVFEVQSDSGTNVVEGDVFATADFVAGTGDTGTGFSRYELDSSNIGTGQQLRILGKVDKVGLENEFGDEHVNLRVQFAENMYNDNTTI